MDGGPTPTRTRSLNHILNVNVPVPPVNGVVSSFVSYFITNKLYAGDEPAKNMRVDTQNPPYYIKRGGDDYYYMKTLSEPTETKLIYIYNRPASNDPDLVYEAPQPDYTEAHTEYLVLYVNKGEDTIDHMDIFLPSQVGDGA